MRYRYAVHADVALLANMNHGLICDEGHRNPMSVAELAQRMAEWLHGEYHAILFEMNGERTGYALFRTEPEFVYLRQFFVVPEFRRRGVGRSAIEWLRQNVWGLDRRVRLDVLSGNGAGIAFWRAIGFRDYCLTLEMDNASTAVERG